MNNAYCLNTYDIGIDPSDRLVDMISRVNIPVGSKIIDIGCGSGRNALYMASLGNKVSAIDFSQNAIALSKRRAKDLPVNFFVSSFDHLSFIDESFDFGIAWRVFHIGGVYENYLAIEEFKRVLKEGAYAFIAVAAACGHTFEERAKIYGFTDRNTITYPSNGVLHTKHYFCEEELFSHFSDFEIRWYELFQEHSGHNHLIKHDYWSIIARRI